MADEPAEQPVEQEQPAAEEPQVEPEQQELEPEEQSLANPEEEPEREPEPETPEEPREPEQQEQPMSRRKAKRLEKLEGLVERLKSPQAQPQNKPNQAIDYRKLIDADDQVYEQLDKVTQDFGQTQFNAGLEQANAVRFHTRLEIDAPRVESKYSQFDRSSPEFNPGVTSAVNEFYLATVGYNPQTDTVQNPNLRYGDFVDALAELGEAMFSTNTARTTKNIVRQAANAGLRPDGSSAKPLNLNKAPEDMTEAELNAAIGATMPRDTRGRFTSQK